MVCTIGTKLGAASRLFRQPEQRPGRLSQVSNAGELHHHRALLRDGFNVHVVYTILLNDRLQQVMMLSKAGEEEGSQRLIVVSSGCSRSGIRFAVLEGIQEAISEDRSHPLTTFALAGLAAFRASAHPTCMHAVSPSRFQSLSPCRQFPNVRTMPFNVSCLVRRRRQGETLKERESGLP